MTEGLWRGVEEPVLSVAEGTPTVLIVPMPSKGPGVRSLSPFAQTIHLSAPALSRMLVWTIPRNGTNAVAPPAQSNFTGHAIAATARINSRLYLQDFRGSKQECRRSSWHAQVDLLSSFPRCATLTAHDVDKQKPAQ